MIIVRITATEPKAALAGVMLSASFAMFIASIAAFKEDRVVSRPFCRWDFVSMVGIRGSYEKNGSARAGCEGRSRTLIRMGGHFVVVDGEVDRIIKLPLDPSWSEPDTPSATTAHPARFFEAPFLTSPRISAPASFDDSRSLLRYGPKARYFWAARD